MGLVKLTVLLLIGSALSCQLPDVPNPPTRVRQVSKNAVIEIEGRAGGSVVLNATKNDGTNMRIELQFSDSSPTATPRVTSCGQFYTCIADEKGTHTTIEVVPTREFVKVQRNSSSPSSRFSDCFSLRDDTQWVGGPQHRYQHWPIQHMYFDEEPYVPSHPTNMAITERYWLSSRGFYIHVSPYVHLFLDQNNIKDKYLCLVTKNKAPYTPGKNTTTSYEFGFFNNSRLAHESVINRHFGKPSGHPDARMVQHPIYSTWARYKANVSEKVVNDFVDEIVSYKFNNSQLEIDDNWETCYGSATFDTKKFPNITRLADTLRKKGFRNTLWIHPFINIGCEPAYSYARNNSYFVKNSDGSTYTTWWQGNNGAGVIDFTNPKAVSWWVGRLKALERLGIDSFKFDAGESSWLPQISELAGAPGLKPGIFTKDYVNALAINFNSMIEARVGWDSQDLPIFIRMIDKDTRYTWNNGLPTLITTLLQMNLAGYVWVLPDMIGGNGYLNGSLNGTFLPTKDLFIRWLQCNVFMPSLQYSFVPWDYDTETVTISRKFTDLHAEIAPTILRLMNVTVSTGAPLNPPIWWVDPTDQEAHKINDEFLLGEEILVAPVIEENVSSRDVYLPRGTWRDANTNRSYVGPTWIRNYPAPLNVLPWFRKQA
ncbi:myogenesis-regulating glycosidase [Diachasma alloeum]|uniref:myogenesis-regulating glycosidase n=1 Tax=Diachasma alloeum TaxID=454923 RepID=UPI0007383E5D|nr:myogenesis-regulating glycosidase [Diachasma alloeum]